MGKTAPLSCQRKHLIEHNPIEEKAKGFSDAYELTMTTPRMEGLIAS